MDRGIPSVDDLGLPQSVVETLDPRQFLALDDAAIEEVWALAARLGTHLVVYAADAEVADGGHLCRALEPASLTSMDLVRITALERRLGPIAVVVAYASPARFRRDPGAAERSTPRGDRSSPCERAL